MSELPASARFYHELPIKNSFNDVSQAENFVPVPEGWHIIISDVVDSTGAIERGNYKEVNIAGASTLIAILNITGELEIPFIFGGDGATLLIPDILMAQVRPVLQSTKNMVNSAFALELRIGVVPVEKVREAGWEVEVTKIRLSNRFSLAGFSGGGLRYAEQLIKDTDAGISFRLESNPNLHQANFKGLECRWNPVRSKRGEILSLLIVATSNDSQRNSQVYGEILDTLSEIFGSEGEEHPVSKENLHLNLSNSGLMPEYLVKNYRGGAARKVIRMFTMRLESKIAKWFMDTRYKIPFSKLRRYKGDLIYNSDYKKFDEMIRMVISSDSIQREKLKEYLEKRYQKGELAYGLHQTDEAMMTCLIFERHGGHLHFIDGANGGYAQAAVRLKDRLMTIDD